VLVKHRRSKPTYSVAVRAWVFGLLAQRVGCCNESVTGSGTVPAASTIARQILIRDMRKTLLGKVTKHGVSKLAAEVIASSKLQVDGGKKVGGSFADETDAKLQSKFNMVEEQLAVVRRELSIKNMNYRHLTRVLLQRAWVFYLAVIVFQLFAAFPRFLDAPNDVGTRTDAELIGLAEFFFRGNETAFREFVGSINSKTTFYTLPDHGTWIYVPPAIAFVYDPALRNAMESRFPNGTNASSCLAGGWQDGWPGPKDWMYAFGDVSDALGF